MSKKIKQLLGIVTAFLTWGLKLKNRVMATLIEDTEPARIREAEKIFANVIIAIWALSIPYFIFVVASIGVQYMLSFGDEQKAASVKKKGGNLFVGAGILFGGFLVVKLVISLLGFRAPDKADCFADGRDITDPFFQIFFPELCSVSGTPVPPSGPGPSPT